MLLSISVVAEESGAAVESLTKVESEVGLLLNESLTEEYILPGKLCPDVSTKLNRETIII